MEPTATINTQYLMTLHAPLQPPQRVSSELLIYNVKPGGWVRGPHIQGKIVGPSADWLHIMPNGTQRLDVRVSVLANDGSYIFVQYGGRIVTGEQFRRKNPPQELARGDRTYFFTNPVFETESSKYSGSMVCIGWNAGAGVDEEKPVCHLLDIRHLMILALSTALHLEL